MGVVLRIIRLAVVAVLVVTATGVGTITSAAVDVPCCEDEGRGEEQPPDCGSGDCSPFCLSCPSRTVAPVLQAIALAETVAITVVAAPEAELTVPSDPPRRGVFHPPRPSLSTLSR